jgi:hypothetical protein
MIAGGLGLVAIGAILRFAVTAEAEGISLTTVGLILLIVGGIAVAIGLALRIVSRDSAGSPN